MDEAKNLLYIIRGGFSGKTVIWVFSTIRKRILMKG